MACEPQSATLDCDGFDAFNMRDEDGDGPDEVTNVVIENIPGHKRRHHYVGGCCESCCTELPPAKKVAVDELDVATALLFTDGPWNVPQPEDSMEGNLQVSGDGKMALFAKLMAAWFNMDEQKENAAMPCLEELYRAFDESDKMSDGEAMDRKCNIDAMLELFLTSQEYDALRKLAELDDTFANRQTVKQVSKFAKRVIDGIYIMDDQKVKIAIAGLEELRKAYDEFDNTPDCEAMVREGELDAMEEQFFVSHNEAPLKRCACVRSFRPTHGANQA